MRSCQAYHYHHGTTHLVVQPICMRIWYGLSSSFGTFFSLKYVSKWFTPTLPACLVCFTHLLYPLFCQHTPSYQCASTVACLTSCGKCSYGCCCCYSVISIQKAAMDPLLCFAQSSSFNLLATLAAYQLPPRIYLSPRSSLGHAFCKILILQEI